ncbi:MAG: methyltransferase [Desulfobacterales bacterium]|jgi:2-polyprenyl-3-methyl-5-hydroxy-6-metoxy-1,4-benzoquinol methylase
MFSIEEFCKAYETETTDIVVNDRKFDLLLPKYLFRFINPHDLFHDFPLWAKIWRASWVLSTYLAEMPVDPNKQILEIGGGVGLVSIVAATAGHRITLSEYNPDALNFARANAQRNNCTDLQIMHLDWLKPRLKTRFDCIVGSEVAYKKIYLDALLQFFKLHLKPDGEIILAWEIRKSGQNLFEFFHSHFDITVAKKTLRSETAAYRIMLMKMHFKK